MPDDGAAFEEQDPLGARGWIDRLFVIPAWIAALVLLFAMVHICADVAARYLGRPWMGTSEFVAFYYMVAIVFLPIALTTYRNGHLRVEFVTQSFSRRRIAILELFGTGLAISVTGIWCWRSILAAIHAVSISERTMVGAGLLAVWPGKVLMAVSASLVLLAFVIRFGQELRRLRDGSPSTGGDEKAG